MCKSCMDGVEGFEPSSDGTKNRCLTAWRYPKKIKFKYGAGEGSRTPDLLITNQLL